MSFNKSKMKLYIQFFVVLSTLVLIPYSVLSANWKLKTADGSFKLYIRESENSPIKEIKIVDKFKGDFKKLTILMNDIETNKKILPSCIDAKLLKDIDVHTSFQYFYFKMPMTVTDRDIVCKIFIYSTDSTYSLTSEAVETKLAPPKKGIIRILNAKTSWTFKKNLKGEITMEYTGLADPNGSIPAWLVNFFAIREAESAIERFKKLLSR